MRRALQALVEQPDIVLIDGNRVPPELGCRAETIVGGDARSYSIAAASIFAKVTRDRYMCGLAESFPGYGWETNAATAAASISPASTGSARRRITAGASRRSCACSNLGCRWRKREPVQALAGPRASRPAATARTLLGGPRGPRSRHVKALEKLLPAPRHRSATLPAC